MFNFDAIMALLVFSFVFCMFIVLIILTYKYEKFKKDANDFHYYKAWTKTDAIKQKSRRK